MGRERYEYGHASRAEELARRRRRGNQSVTEMVQADNMGPQGEDHPYNPRNEPEEHFGVVADGPYADAQRLRNYWKSREIEAMQDEGDALNPPRPVITGRTVIFCALAAVVVYVLLVGALVLINA